jgi:hypothetical protein
MIHLFLDKNMTVTFKLANKLSITLGQDQPLVYACGIPGWYSDDSWAFQTLGLANGDDPRRPSLFNMQVFTIGIFS